MLLLVLQFPILTRRFDVMECRRSSSSSTTFGTVAKLHSGPALLIMIFLGPGFDPLGLLDPEGSGGFLNPEWLPYAGEKLLLFCCISKFSHLHLHRQPLP
jgi:hypothetical protein